MKLTIIIISILLIGSCIELNMADDPSFFYTLNETFKVQVFIPYYSYFTMNLLTLPTNDIIVSNTSFIVFNLTNGTLSSDSNHGTYYLKNQTGTGYPPYILKQGQATPTDASRFRATHNATIHGNFLSIDIQGVSSLASTNGWVACNTAANVYSIGWDSDLTTQPPEGCINIAKYSPGVLLHVGYI